VPLTIVFEQKVLMTIIGNGQVDISVEIKIRECGSHSLANPLDSGFRSGIAECAITLVDV